MNFGLFLFSGNTNSSTSLLSSNEDAVETLGSISLLTDSSEANNGGIDAFGSKDMFGNPNYEMLESCFMANAASVETIGSVAQGAETIGSVAMGAETIGSVACDCSTGFSGASSDSSCSSGGFTSVC